MRVAGIDSTKGGWVAIELEDGRVVADHLIRPQETDFSELGNVSILVIDIPIGFGPRLADSAARAYLSGAASTVFTTPTRRVLEMPFGPGLGVSAQSHALGPRILHVTALAATDERIYEAHPEVSFRAMKRGMPLHYRKKSAGGVLERVELLRRQGIELRQLYAALRLRSTMCSMRQHARGRPSALLAAKQRRCLRRLSSWTDAALLFGSN